MKFILKTHANLIANIKYDLQYTAYSNDLYEMSSVRVILLSVMCKGNIDTSH